MLLTEIKLCFIFRKPDLSESPQVETQSTMDRDKVWVADPKAGFVLGRIVEFADDGPIVQPMDKGLKPVVTTYDRMYPAEEDDRKEVEPMR